MCSMVAPLPSDLKDYFLVMPVADQLVYGDSLP